jgi:hypothetical protein
MPDPITITYHGVTASVRAWSDLLGLNYYTLLTRIRRGWPSEKAIETPVRHKGGGRRTHGMTYSKEYGAWLGMRYRCSSRRGNRWRNYGGKGIKVCKRWGSFEAFYDDMGPAPSDHHSLGRLDHDGPYAPGNVAWQTPAEQVRCWRESRRRGNTA